MQLTQFSLRRLFFRLNAGMDQTLLTIAIILVGLGLLTLFSASYDYPQRVTAQLINLAVAFTAMWVVAQLQPQTLMRFALPVYLLGLILLIAVALFGDVANGARRWLHLGVARIQPSEIMKIAKIGRAHV